MRASVQQGSAALLGALVAILFAMAGCRNGTPGADAKDATSSSASPDAGPEAGCAWLLASDPDLINSAYPDESAYYWVAELPFAPEVLHYRIEGRYPEARYFSFNAYDSALRPTDAVTDFQITPDAPHANPFQFEGVPYGSSYALNVLPQAVPAEREPNTRYAGSTAMPGGAPALPNPRVSLIYRIYLPADGSTGKVELPRAVAVTAVGEEPVVLGPCQALSPEGVTIVNDTIREANFPAPAVAPFPFSAPEPEFRRFYGLPDTARILLGNALGQEIPPNPATAGDGGGFLSNRDNAYATALFSRDKGSLYIVRAKAPSYPGDTRMPAGKNPQLRYWSFCTNELASQRYVACLHDAAVTPDRNGYFTLVVSDPAERPANALPENGMHWLPWGGAFYDSVAIYRHMLPDSGFAPAIQNIPYGTAAADVMLEYYPRAHYCDRAVIESAGTSAAGAFAACGAAHGG